MKRKVLKLLSIVLSGTIFLGTVSPVSAYNLDENDNSIEMIEYQNTEDEDFSNVANVFAQLGSEYKVTIPKAVVLSGESKDASYIVKVEGDIAGYEQISVIPDESFNLYTKKKDPQKAFVSQDKTVWTVHDFGINANGTIKANTITAGKWTGAFNFNINLEDGEKVAGDIIIAHVYDAGKVTKEATCTEDGIKTYTCSCGDVKTEIISKLSHNYVEGTCTRCGDTLPALSVTASGFTGDYDSKAHSITVTSAGNTIQYSTDNTNWTNTNPTYTNAGTYTVYYKVSKDGYKTVTGSQKVVINKIASTLNTAPTAKTGLVYTGSAQPLVNAGTATNGTIQYKLGNGSYSTSIPSIIDAGTYNVYYKVIGDANYNDIAEKSLTVTISKITPIVTAPTTKTLTYTGSAQALVNAGSTTGGTMQYRLGTDSYGTAIPTATNAGTYTIYYKVVGNANYNDVTENSLTVTIGEHTHSSDCYATAYGIQGSKVYNRYIENYEYPCVCSRCGYTVYTRESNPNATAYLINAGHIKDGHCMSTRICGK